MKRRNEKKAPHESTISAKQKVEITKKLHTKRHQAKKLNKEKSPSKKMK